MKKKITIFLTIALLCLSVKAVYAVDWTGIACTDVTGCPNATQYICANGPNPNGPGTLKQCGDISGSVSNTSALTGADNYIRGSIGSALGGGAGGNGATGRGITDIFIDSIGDAPYKAIGGNQQALGFIASLYTTKPASTVEYIADLRSNMGLPTPQVANAQGFGFSSISPILTIWRITRNIALAGFVIVFMIVGIMIMLRSKIDPRTVITIQQAIPKLIISLIMVIFSYAIVGFMIDITTVLTRIGASLLQNARLIAYDGTSNPGANSKLLDSLTSRTLFDLISPMLNFNVVIDSIRIPGSFFNPVNLVLGGAAKGGLLGAVLSIAVFIALLRTFFSLLEAYLKVTLGIILAPIQFLFYAIPGQGKGFGDWFRGMFANLLVFPAVFFMLSFAAIFYAQTGNPVWFTKNNGWNVGVQSFGPTTKYWSPVGLGDWGGAVGPLLSLAIILTVPKAAATVRELVHPGYKAGAAEGEVSKGVQAAAGKIPIVGSLTRL